MSEAVANQHKALVRRFVDATNSGQHDLLDQIVHQDLVRHSQSTPSVKVRSREEFKQFLHTDRATFPDGRMTLETLVAEGPFVAFYGKFTGTQQGPMGTFPATGRPVAVDASGLFRIDDGRIAELWILWDNVALLSQLGHLVEPDGEPG